MPSIDLKDQYFGCEIEMTGLTRQQAAEAVASLFGTNAVHSRSSRTYDPWEVTDNEGKNMAVCLRLQYPWFSSNRAAAGSNR